MKKHKYFELPVSQFLARYPQFRDLLPQPVLYDSRYLVRFVPESGLVEVGFRDDAWTIS